MIGAVLVRSLIGSRQDIKETLKALGLVRKHACVLVPDTPSFRAMLKKVKDYITFGEVDDTLIKELDLKARRIGMKTLKVYRLQPPKGGFERKGIKKTFKQGGALGYRGKEVNQLIKRMLPKA